MYVTKFYHLPGSFIKQLSEQPVPWGFGAFSEMTFYSRYSRKKADGTNEAWWEVVKRCIEGEFSILMSAAAHAGRRWDSQYWDDVAQRAARSMFALRWLPPGRGLWAQGTDFVYERGSDALNNCCFVDIIDLADDASFLMDKLMKGVGVGFSTHRWNGQVYPVLLAQGEPFVIGDSREGWVASVQALLKAYSQKNGAYPWFDYSQIRPKGARIKGFGGVSGGYEPLKRLHDSLIQVMDAYIIGRKTRSELVTDVCNLIGVCVIAGNVRRSAEIALGHPDDQTFRSLKNPEVFPERNGYPNGWGHLSNNSIILSDPDSFDDYLPEIAKSVQLNGEPGIVNQYNITNFSRMGTPGYDPAVGINPCGEIPLESYECCNLVPIFPTRCTMKYDLSEAAFFASLYGMAVSLLPSDDWRTEAVISRNHRIGVGLSGLADWVDSTGLLDVCLAIDHLYHRVVSHLARLSRFFGVPAPIAHTTVKPDGTVSLLAGVSPGMHWPWSPYVLRRVRQSTDSAVAQELIEQGIPYEPDAKDPTNTLVFEFPLAYGKGKTRAQGDVSLLDQLSALSMYQQFWADNSVSCTATFQPHEADEIAPLLKKFVPKIKSVSLLPDFGGFYQQPPFEAISKGEYERRTLRTSKLNFKLFAGADPEADRFCDSEVCVI